MSSSDHDGNINKIKRIPNENYHQITSDFKYNGGGSIGSHCKTCSISDNPKYWLSSKQYWLSW